MILPSETGSVRERIVVHTEHDSGTPNEQENEQIATARR